MYNIERTRKPITLVVLLALGTILTGALPANAQTDSSDRKSRTVTATGEGRVNAAPDMATLSFSVVTRNADPERARMENERQSAEALETIRDLGVEEKNIRLEHLSLQPVREWDPEQKKHIDKGFEVTRTVFVRLLDLDLVPTVIAGIVGSGANRIGNVRYGLSDRSSIEKEALRAAVTDARAKAETMLSSLDERVGRPVEVAESTTGPPVPIVRESAMMAVNKVGDSEPEAYAPGEIEVVARVFAVFEIED